VASWEVTWTYVKSFGMHFSWNDQWHFGHFFGSCFLILLKYSPVKIGSPVSSLFDSCAGGAPWAAALCACQNNQQTCLSHHQYNPIPLICSLQLAALWLVTWRLKIHGGAPCTTPRPLTALQPTVRPPLPGRHHDGNSLIFCIALLILDNVKAILCG
jgi:hypothetical protein